MLWPFSLFAGAELVTDCIRDSGDIPTSALVAELEKSFPLKSEIFSAQSKNSMQVVAYEYLDMLFPRPHREACRIFAFVRDAPSEFARYSALELREAGVVLGHLMNFRERLLFELKFYEKFGRHPDDRLTETLCIPATLEPRQQVATVSFRNGCLLIKLYPPDTASKSLRPRRAISP